MVNNYCLICKTPPVYSNALSRVDIINQELNRTINKFKNEISKDLLRNKSFHKYNRIYFNVKNDSYNVSYICRNCFRLNKTLLVNKEDLLRENIIKIIFLYHKELIPKSKLRNIQVYFAGNYPRIVREIIRNL